MNTFVRLPRESEYLIEIMNSRHLLTFLEHNRYTAEYRSELAERVDALHTLEDIIYIRNTPYLSSILKMIRNDYLSRKDYPFLLKPPANYDVSDQPHENEVSQEVLSEFTPKRRRRLIVVVIGGVSYNELHHLRTIAKELKQKLVIVTTSLLTPQMFIKTLSEIDSVA